MKTIISIVIMSIAAIVGFYLGTTRMPSEITTILFAMIAGFACTIYAIDSNKKK